MYNEFKEFMENNNIEFNKPFEEDNNTFRVTFNFKFEFLCKATNEWMDLNDDSEIFSKQNEADTLSDVLNIYISILQLEKSIVKKQKEIEFFKSKIITDREVYTNGRRSN